jgi:Gas vesicle synthesis protein GvpL/GvpF
VSGLYCYAFLDRPPPERPKLRGLRGEPLRLVRGPGFVLVGGEMPDLPPVTAVTLRGHDATVRRLAATVPAVLPFRFGALVPDGPALVRQLGGVAALVRAALRLVADREQMTIRIAGRRARGRAAATPQHRGPVGGPGSRYLRRRAGLEAREVPALASLRAALSDLILAERVERAPRAGPLRASVHHLIPRGRAPAYRRRVRRAATASGAAVTISGPWPPYAFAAELLP